MRRDRPIGVWSVVRMCGGGRGGVAIVEALRPCGRLVLQLSLWRLWSVWLVWLLLLSEVELVWCLRVIVVVEHVVWWCLQV